MQGIWIVIKGFGKFIQGIGTFFLGVFTVLMLSLLLAGSQSKPGVTVPKGAVLVLNPYGSIVEQTQPKSPIDAALGKYGQSISETSIHDILASINNAATDDRIAAIAIDTDSMGGAGISHIHDMVSAIQYFKQQEKPVYAISTSYSQGAYLLASQADTVFMNPVGSAMLNGYNQDVMYFKDMLDKIGVTMNIFHVGDFKSAIEPFERTSMSPEAREASAYLLSGLWNDFLTTVGEARDIDTAVLQQNIDTMPAQLKAAKGDFAAMAKAMGLVDKLAPRQDWRRYIASKHSSDGDSFTQISLQQYRQATRQKGNTSDNQIAIIVAQGEIVDGYGPVNVSASETLARKIRIARTNKNTKAIIIRVNSPGGSAYGSEIIRQELAAAQKDGIPVIASMASVAASGGYWISATADEIWAAPTTITGSIGIFGLIPSFEKASKWVGISSDSVGTTKLAGMMSLDRPLTDSAKSIIRQSIDKGYDEFITLVATGRGMDKDAVHKIAQGRVWTGRQALENGLVDKLGGLKDAIQSAATLAELGADYDAYIVTERPDGFDQFLLSLMGGSIKNSNAQPLSASEKMVASMKSELDFLARLNDPRGRYVICADCKVK